MYVCNTGLQFGVELSFLDLYAGLQCQVEYKQNVFLARDFLKMTYPALNPDYINRSNS